MRNEATILECIQTFFDSLLAMSNTLSLSRMCLQVATTQLKSKEQFCTLTQARGSNYKDNKMPFTTAGDNIHNSIKYLLIYMQFVNNKRNFE